MNMIMVFANNIPPDTTRYMLSAYLVIGLMIAGYIGSLVWRWRWLKIRMRALKALEAMDKGPGQGHESEKG
jgi:hypothetical protein